MLHACRGYVIERRLLVFGIVRLYLCAVVITALGAYAVADFPLLALRTSDEGGLCRLAVAGIPLVAPLLGYFTLGNCHFDSPL